MPEAKVMVVFGVRPEAIKMAPVVRALKRRRDIFNTSVVVTAQHREMLDQVLDHFDIRPDHDLDIMRPRQSLTEIAVRALEGLERVFVQEKPDLVLVHGDTSTTFVASLAAFYQKIPVGHVEAGLRTGLKYSPFPEEMNRKLTAALADLHFAPTTWARGNLLREGISGGRIFVTGNTAIDALKLTVRPGYRFSEDILNRVDGGRHKVVVADAHRRENFGQPMQRICSALGDILERCEEALLVFSVHRNPEVTEVAYPLLRGRERAILVEPLTYPDWANLMSRARLIITDSGGIQEEAPSLGVPVLLLRDATERPEAIEAGTVKMVGTSRERIAGAALELLRDDELHGKMSRAVNPYGDGMASERIVEAIAFHMGYAPHRPSDFVAKYK